MKKVLVIGSSNVDLVMRTKRFPNPGETIMCESFKQNLGGKGLNQAVALKLSGADVTFLTALGNDNNKDFILNELKKYDLNVKPIIKNSSTGTAVIVVNSTNSENKIIVDGGANILLNKEDIDNNIDLIKEADYILLQLEINRDVIEYIINIAYDLGKTIILNPAPYKDIDINVIKKVTYITPNLGELGQIIKEYDNHVDKAYQLNDLGVKNVIVTLGSKGSFYMSKYTAINIKGFVVKAIDTTGAGDCYNGVFVSFLSQGYSLIDSLNYASKASAISVTREGAAKSYPTLNEILKENIC